jgi:transposase
MSDAPSVANPNCPECARLRAEVASLTAKVAQLEFQVRDLLARLNQNSSNSSRPPSSDPPWQAPRSGPRSGRKPGGQDGHPGHFRKRLPPERVKHVVRHVPAQCACCGAALSQDPGPHDPEPTWHQVAELPEQPVEITEHQGQARTCAHCGHVTRAEIPAAVRAHVCGPRLSGAISFLSARCHASKRRVVEIVETVFGLALSLGAVSRCEAEMSAALVPGQEEVTRAVRAASALNLDETGWLQHGKKRWLWLAASRGAALFKILSTRGLVGVRTLLGERPANHVTSDRWNAYNSLPLSQRQSCWSHLARDFQGLVDYGAGAEQLGVAGLHAAALLFETWSDFKAERCDRTVLQARLEPVRRGLRENLQRARDGPAGRAKRFAGHLLPRYETLWTFAAVPGVEPTNNHAERQLRPAVLWRKRSFGNHSDGGCRFAERILSVVQTLHLQHRPILDYLAAALAAHRQRRPCPTICLSTGD